MNYYYPWIDPRVKRVRTEYLVDYLQKKGWLEEKKRREHFICFRHPTKNAGVYLPDMVDADDYSRCILDAVTQLAKIEERYAGDVLTDLLLSFAATEKVAENLPHPVQEKSDPLAQPVNR